MAAFGDFGSGSRHQFEVADAIQRRHASEPFNLGMTMGDNFYRCGVRSVEDRKWQSRWEDLYTPLGIPFYATLGNHDYGHPPVICPVNRGSPQAEIARSAFSVSWKMPARYYTFAAGPVRFFAIDTEGWSARQLRWIEEALAASAEEPGIRWRIVYGHHPMLTSGVHLNQRRIGALRRQLLPVLEAANVDLYVSGHDHDMEHLQSGTMHFFICGTGGAELRRVREQQPESVFTAAEFGFLDLSADEHRLSVQFFNTDLEPLEENPLTLTRE